MQENEKIHTAVNIKKFLKYPLNDLKTFLIIFAYVQEFIKKNTTRVELFLKRLRLPKYLLF